MGIICPRCHRELKEDVKFCNVCGISLDTQMPKLKIKWDESSQDNPQRLFSEYICKICGQPIKYIKQYIKDPLIIKGDYIAGGGKVEVRDSVVQRSKIGSDIKDKKGSNIEWE